MHAPTIGTLEGSKTILVLRDENGNSMGTGSKEALGVLRYITTRANSKAPYVDISREALRIRPMANVRSALVF